MGAVVPGIQVRVWRALQPGAAAGGRERIWSLALFALIVANVAAVIMESVSSLGGPHAALFQAFELFSVVVFTAEYVLRIWACTVDVQYRRPVVGRIRFALTPMALVDLAAVLPFYLPFVLALDMRVIRVVRLARLVRLLKVGRYSESLATLGRVFRSKSTDLAAVLMLIAIGLVLASSLMYAVENAAQPEAFSSIPAAMWWSMVTLTTVGYGDVYPITPLGKILGAFIALLGVGIVALPAGMLGSGFVEEMHKRKAGPEAIRCPHCGRLADEEPAAEPAADAGEAVRSAAGES